MGTLYPRSAESRGKKMENEMEARVIQGFIGIRVSQNYGYHFGGPHMSKGGQACAFRRSG